MGFKCGLVGMPNVGKSSIFNLLTKQSIPANNYPFCTIDPNNAFVEVPDERLSKLSKINNSKKSVNAAIEFVDIAGLIKGASKGEGLGNEFLSHINSVDVIAHVVRFFEDKDIIHVKGSINPSDDFNDINLELILSDLNQVTKYLDRINKKKMEQKEKNRLSELLSSLIMHLEEEKFVSNYEKIEELLDIRTNQDVAQLKDHAFLGNKTKTNKLLSDTILEEEKNIYYLNMINQRLNKLNDIHSINNENLEVAVNSLKPPIFWKDKPIDNPLNSKYEGIILASIIEKESSSIEEKMKIGGVFLNRIKIKMKLQADPTIIYGLMPDFNDP